MNLHGIASAAVSAINPMQKLTIKVSAGYSTVNYKQIPKYTTRHGTGQIQPLSTNDLKRLQGLNVQNVTHKIYLTGNYEGVFRVLGKGGDMITVNGREYLVTAVIERWPDWTAVGVTAQVN